MLRRAILQISIEFECDKNIMCLVIIASCYIGFGNAFS